MRNRLIQWLFLFITLGGLISLFLPMMFTVRFPDDMFSINMKISTPMNVYVINLADDIPNEITIREYNAAGVLRYPNYSIGLGVSVFLGAAGFFLAASDKGKERKTGLSDALESKSEGYPITGPGRQ